MQFAKLIVKGIDAGGFLQGQLTGDIDNLDFLYEHKQDSGLAGLCNIKGRLEAVFWVEKIDRECYFLYLPVCISEEICNLLKKYIFRSKVSIEVADVSDGELANIPKLFVIPWIVDITRGKFVPQMVSLDVLKGIHPKKGCYIGQEIVTRLRDLGKNKKRLAKLNLGKDNSINIGDNIYLNDIIIGEVILKKDDNALAVLTLAQLDESFKISDAVFVENIWKDEKD